MPYRTDKSAATSLLETFTRSTGTSFNVNVIQGRTRTQHGFRSRPLTEAERVGVDGRNDRTWKDTLRVIQGYEYEYNSRPGRQASRVNNRDYKETQSVLSKFGWGTTAYRESTDEYFSSSGSSGLHLTSTCPESGTLYPSDAVAASKAATQMRNSVPTAPAVDLVRSIGELRDLPRAANLRNYIPMTGNDYASAYLTQVFGLNPTAKDIANIANAVIESTPIVQRFLSHEQRRLSRRRTEEVGSLTFNREFIPSGSSTDSMAIRDDGGITWGVCTVYAPPSGRQSSGSYSAPFTVHVNVTATAVVRSFATYEYFIPRPTGFPGRVDLYRRKAEQVLGSGLSAGALYDLTPWSWMLDWFANASGGR